MPSFADSIFLFVLALLLFGPKKLPVLARELGKWMGEFRRASNEFKMQMEDELRAVEQQDRQKQIAAMEAAAPIPPPLSDPVAPERHTSETAPVELAPEPSLLAVEQRAESTASDNDGNHLIAAEDLAGNSAAEENADGVRPLPIATSGSLKMMPPATGLPMPRSTRPGTPLAEPPSAESPTPEQRSGALTPLVEAIPAAPAASLTMDGAGGETGNPAHGD